MRTDERETYRLHARLPVHRRRVDRARKAILSAMEAVPGPWGVSVSGGKDSVVVAHLAREAGVNLPLFHYHASEHPQENTDLVIELGRQLDSEVIVATISGDWDFWEREGRVVISTETDDDRRLIAAHDREYRRQISEAVAGAGLVGMFWGLRRSESRTRDLAIGRHGKLYRAQSRSEWTCHPIADWSARDVWAYHLTHDLPYLARYDLAADRERERSETTYIFGPDGDGLWRTGQGQRLRESDVAEWVRLCDRFPELRNYG